MVLYGISSICSLFYFSCRSVADPGCLSRILTFTHPGSRIQDLKTAEKERGEKKFVVMPCLYPQISHKWTLFYFWHSDEKKFGPFSKNYRTFYSKIVTKLSKILVWDIGSEIRDPEKTYSVSQIRGSKKYRIRNTGFSVIFFWSTVPSSMIFFSFQGSFWAIQRCVQPCHAVRGRPQHRRDSVR